jgi:hypothetical protein
VGQDGRKTTVRKRTIAAISLAGALLVPNVAMAKYEAGGGSGSGNNPGVACGAQVLDVAFSNDELSANERIMADAWKSHLHARKARALEGVD